MTVPEYIWPDPEGTGWIDAWNGWYETIEEARQDAAGGIGRPWDLRPGEGLISEGELNDRHSGRSLTQGKVRIDWDELGEGWSGDYNPEDPEDEELLRFTVYRFEGDDAMLAHAQEDSEFDALLAADGLGWQPVDDASYCTQTPVDVPPEIRRRLLEVLMDKFHDAVHSGQSVKKLGERLSWISPEWPESDPNAPTEQGA